MVRPSRTGRGRALLDSEASDDGVVTGDEIDWETGPYEDTVARDQWKQPVRFATTGDEDLSTIADGDTVDGVMVATGDRGLFRAQTATEQNGIYVIGASAGDTARAADMDEGEEVVGAVLYVIEGTANGETVFRCDLTAVPAIDLDPITFAELSAGGSGSLTVEESDASPSVSGVDTIIVDAADFTLVDNMDGSVTLTTDEPDATAHIADTTDAHDASAISIADSGGYFTGTDVEAALQELGAGGGGGGGFSQAYIGYNTAGGTWDVPGVNSKMYFKQVTIASNCLLTSIGAYVSLAVANNISNGPSVGLYTDNAGAPGIVIAYAPALNMRMTGTARWVDVPIGAWVPAGTYWLAVKTSDLGGAAVTRLAYDGSGSDRVGTGAAQSMYDWANVTSTSTTTNKFSIRGTTIA